jgi:hypothetical protein
MRGVKMKKSAKVIVLVLLKARLEAFKAEHSMIVAKIRACEALIKETEQIKKRSK